MYNKYLKRLVDIVCSLLGLILLSPIYMCLIIAIKIDDPGPAFFIQKRVGIHKTHFNMAKFRTMKMITPKDCPTHLLENPEQYITRMGKFLRRTSLDEIPQLINIFTGKMSIVGPRPALWNQFDLIAMRDENSANDVRPGLTGWAQINGRDELELVEKAKLDGDYAKALCDGHGLAMDMKCLLGTVRSVLKGEGVVEGGTGKYKRR